jgi:nitrile hydratase
MSSSHEQDHGHSGPHAHAHPEIASEDGPPTEYQLMEIALRELLIEKGVLTAEAMRRQIEDMDGRNAGRGARMVARAWCDDGYRRRMLANGAEAAAELGLDIGPTHLICVENTAAVHNVVVCTLCSCYPRMLLGLPPDWYKSREYRTRVVREPRAVLAEFGTIVADDVEVRVHDSTADMRYLVIPRRPQGTQGWTRDELASLVTRDTMIGVAVATVNAPGGAPTGE